MKWLLSSLIAFFFVVIAIYFWPEDSSPKTTFVKNESLSLNVNFSSTLTPSSSVITTSVKVEPAKVIIFTEPENIAFQAPSTVPTELNAPQPIYSFENMWSVLLRHLQRGISQTELAQMRQQAIAADLPVQWLFAAGVAGNENSEALSGKYWFNFMTLKGKGELITAANAHQQKLAFIQLLKDCNTCAYNHLADQLNDVFGPNSQMNASNHYEAQNEFRPFYAYAKLTLVYAGNYLSQAETEGQKKALKAEFIDDANLLINSDNEVMRMSGRSFKAILTGDTEVIKLLAHESDDIPYMYLLASLNPIPHQELFDYVKKRLKDGVVGKDREEILSGAIYHAQFYSVSEAAEVITLLIKQFPDMKHRAISSTILKAQKNQVKRLADQWQDESYENETYEGKKGRIMSQEDMIKLAFNIFARVENHSSEQLMQRFNRNFDHEEEAMRAFNNLSWTQMVPFLYRLSQPITRNWNRTLEQLNKEGFEHPFNAASAYEFDLLWAWNRGGDKSAEIKHIFPQLTAFTQNAFINILEKDGSKAAKALLFELH